jgi:hypothetical protein
LDSRRSNREVNADAGRRATRGTRAAAGIVLAISVALAAHASGVLSSPNDEFVRITSGLAALRLHDYRMDFATPPLAKYLVAAPLLSTSWNLALDDATWRGSDDQGWTRVVVYEAGNDPLRMLRLARPPMLLVLLGLGLLVFTWTRRLYGPRAALLATAVFALSPNTLAYAWFANMDLALALAFDGAIFLLWRFLERPRRGRLVACGAALGAALGTHFAAIALGVIVPCLFVFAALRRPTLERDAGEGGWREAFPGFGRLAAGRWRFVAVCLAVLGLVAALTVWVIYGFEVQPLLRHAPTPGEKIAWIEQHVPGPAGLRAWAARSAAEAPVPGASFARGILSILRRTGEAGTQGHPWFYLVVLVTKLPLPVLILLAWASLRRPRRPSYDEAFLLLPAALFFLLASASAYQSGLRNLTPILPLLAVYTGRVLEAVPSRMAAAPGIFRKSLPAGIGVWLGLVALHVHPYHLSYYNALVGGPDGGIRVSVGSTDLDWGQGLIGLRTALARLGEREVFLGSPGRVRPEIYGVRARRIGFEALRRPERLVPGLYAVSTTYVRRLQWLQARSPLARVGNVLWIYRIGEGTSDGARSEADRRSDLSLRPSMAVPISDAMGS